jgi:type III restriction enzyme
VFLSNDNLEILNDELEQNFRITADELQNAASDKERVQVRVVEPPVKIRLVRVRKQYVLREKDLASGLALGLDRSDKDVWNNLVEKYRLIETQQDGLTAAQAAQAATSRAYDLTERREKRTFSTLMLVAEIARYLNRSPLNIECLLEATKEKIDELVAIVNEFNELLRRNHPTPFPTTLRPRRNRTNRGARGRTDQAAAFWLLRGHSRKGQDRPN